MNIYFDTETTSLYPGQICQLSYVLEDGDSISGKNFFFSVDKIDPAAQSVHGLSKERLALLSDGKRFCDHVSEIASDFKDSVLFAHNFSFDYGFMQAEFSRVGKLFRYKDSFCTMKKFTPVCKIPRSNGAYKYPKLSELCDFFDLTPEKIGIANEMIFSDNSSFHSATFDSTSVFLCVKEALNRQLL